LLTSGQRAIVIKFFRRTNGKTPCRYILCIGYRLDVDSMTAHALNTCANGYAVT